MERTCVILRDEILGWWCDITGMAGTGILGCEGTMETGAGDTEVREGGRILTVLHSLQTHHCSVFTTLVQQTTLGSSDDTHGAL